MNRPDRPHDETVIELMRDDPAFAQELQKSGSDSIFLLLHNHWAGATVQPCPPHQLALYESPHMASVIRVVPRDDFSRE